MKNDRSTLTYNLKAVVLETGLKPVTLRAWERRYGLPQPQRTEGGHRLYTERDIAIIKWLMGRQAEGVSIRQAVNMWQKLIEQGNDPLEAELTSDTQETQLITIIPADIGEQIAMLRKQWIEACLAFDERQAERTLLNAFSIFPAEVICLELLQKAISEIGAGWYRGQISVQQEHFASALATRRVEMLISGTPPPTRPERIVIGCAPQDTHTFAPLVLTFLLRRYGWNTVYLGGNVPGENLESVLSEVSPTLVILSAQLLYTAANLMEVAYSLKPEGVLVGYGGLIFNTVPTLRQYIPGYFLGETLANATQTVQNLLTNPHFYLPSTPKKASEAYIRTLSHFQEKRGLIETAVWDTLTATEISTTILTNANANIARTIIASLKLGNIDFLGTEIAWVESLLRGYHMPTELLQSYLTAYHAAAKTHLDTQGKIITDWLGELLDSKA